MRNLFKILSALALSAFLVPCLLIPCFLWAQIPSGYVQTTGTVAALANGTYAAAWTNLSSSPQLGLLGGVSTFQQTVNGTLDGNGHFSVLLADTAQIIPTPSTWTFTFTFNCPPVNTGFMVAVAVTGGGGTEDISSQIVSALPSNPCTGSGGGSGTGHVVAAQQYKIAFYPINGVSATVGGTAATVDANGNMTANNNHVLNVMQYGAKCDGTTNDQTAIQAAFNAAVSLNYSVQFPAGVCFTSTINYNGVSFFGAGPNVSEVLGAPGQDVFQGPDGGSYIQKAHIHDIQIKVDNSVNAAATAVGGNNTFPNRITGTAGGTTALNTSQGGPPAPGPQVFGSTINGGCAGSVSTGSPGVFNLSCGAFSSTYSEFIIGAPITINGAGVAGATYTGTITARNSNTQVAISPNISTTVASASGSWGTGIQPPWYIGNCGMALPETVSNTNSGLSGWTFDHVWFTSTSSSNGNYSCGALISAQSNNMTFDHVQVQFIYGGLIEYPPQPGAGAFTPDTNNYTDTYITATLPLVMYNGAHRSFHGLNILNGGNPFALGMFWFNTQTGSGTIDQYYNECFSNGSGEQARLGPSVSLTIGGGSLTQCGMTSQYVNFTGNNVVSNAEITSLHVSGNHNIFRNTNATVASITDTGNDNKIETGMGIPQRNGSLNREAEAVNVLDSSWLETGSITTPYLSGKDLSMTCRDFNFTFVNSGAGGPPGCTSDLTDASNPFGSYVHTTTAGYASGWCIGVCGGAGQGNGPNGKQLIIGDRIPQAKMNVVVIARCPTAATTCTNSINVYDTTAGNVQLNSSGSAVTTTFGTGWTIQSWPINASSAPLGDVVTIVAGVATGTSVTTEDIAFVGFAPVTVPAGTLATTITISSFTAAPNACYGNTGTLNTPTTTTMTGLTTAMAPHWSYNSDPRTIVGWGSTGGMDLKIWPSALNTLSSEVCNVTASSITTGAITFNIGAP